MSELETDAKLCRCYESGYLWKFCFCRLFSLIYYPPHTPARAGSGNCVNLLVFIVLGVVNAPRGAPGTYLINYFEFFLIGFGCCEGQLKLVTGDPSPVACGQGGRGHAVDRDTVSTVVSARRLGSVACGGDSGDHKRSLGIVRVPGRGSTIAVLFL